MKKIIKIYGERNTGTNYLSKLISLNLHAEQLPERPPWYFEKLRRLQKIIFKGNDFVSDLFFPLTYNKNLGWKHTYVIPEEILKRTKNFSAPVVFVTLTKNPYSWLLSLYRHPYHNSWSNKPTFQEFIKEPWKSNWIEIANQDFETPIDLWNCKNKAYMNLQGFLPVLNIRYEDLVQVPDSIIKEISDSFSISCINQKFINYETSTKGNNKKDYDYYKDYYINEEWRNEFDSDLIEFINDITAKTRTLTTKYTYPTSKPIKGRLNSVDKKDKKELGWLLSIPIWVLF